MNLLRDVVLGRVSPIVETEHQSSGEYQKMIEFNDYGVFCL